MFKLAISRGVVLAAIVVLLLVLGATLLPRRTDGNQSGGTSAGQIVSQFFPATLASGPEVTPGSWVEQTRESAHVVLETQPDGRPRALLAAYTNGVSGAIRLILLQGDDSYQVVQEPSGLDLGGPYVSAELLDVDGDSRMDAVVHFSSFRAQTTEWIFRWNGSSVENLTPLLPEDLGSKSSQLVLSKFVDLDLDGKLEIISEENYPPQTDENGYALGGSVVFKLGATGYVVDRPLLSWGNFVRRSGPPRTDATEFLLLADSSGPYTLKLTNGAFGGSKRVSSARIVLNGTEILAPNQFSQQIEFLTVSVNLQKENRMEVTLAGIPLGEVWITIEDEAAVQRARNPQ